MEYIILNFFELVPNTLLAAHFMQLMNTCYTYPNIESFLKYQFQQHNCIQISHQASLKGS